MSRRPKKRRPADPATPRAAPEASAPRRSGRRPSRRAPLSLQRKLWFAVTATVLGLLGVELALAFSGVHPILYREDPYVGFSSRIPLYVEHKRPDGGVEMVTAPNKISWFNAQRFLRDKPSGTYRIFCMGGSTTYGRPYSDATSFCGWLREFLPVAAPHRDWEVINAGGISYASYRVATLMEELIQYQPDLFIIYSGHNEFLEDRTYGDIKQPSPMRGLSALLSYTRIYSAVRGLVQPPAAAGTAGGTGQHKVLSSEVTTQLDNSVGPNAYHRDDIHAQHVMQHYRFNLNRMIDIAQSAGARVMFVTPASNWKDCSPFKSQHGESINQTEAERREQLISEAERMLEQGQPQEAWERLESIQDTNQRHARYFYVLGRTLEALERFDAARDAYQRSLNEDVCPLRALTETREICAEVARDRSIPIVDFVSIVAWKSPHGIPGENLFLDHVHPTIDGHNLLALALIDGMAKAGWCKTDPDWNAITIARVTQQVESRIDNAEHGVALRNLAKVLTWAGKSDEANRLALRADALEGANAETHYLAGNALAAQGDLDDACDKYRQALAQNPNFVLAHNALGVAYQQLNRLDDAKLHYRKAIQLKEDFAPAHSNFGMLLRKQGDMAGARQHLERAIAINSEYADARNNLGLLLLQQNDLDGATEQFERVLNIDPELVETHYNLARIFLRQGKMQEAALRLERAIALDPNYWPAHASLGLIRYDAGQIPAALQHLRKAVQTDRPPLNAAAALAWILATTPDSTMRDGRESLQWATYCVEQTGGREARYLAAVAAAHAELGDFTQATTWLEKALPLAPADEQFQYRRRLDEYRGKERP